ncbi:hypothetical protein RUM43_002106 [Polyplax serrata]|uniref:Sodium channel modifier 1 n=1 Tax=Polyplax serrata TaxID=468196 RepID=A0AAN8NYC9_POLSC
MSFKRDGNDTNLLKNLQHRRVAEILGDHIPNDEATLLSNGKLTCTVCSKRPIFDTMQMLSLHRKGKKHLFELSIYLEHKRDLEYKKVKQTQRSFLKTNQVTIEPVTSAITFKGCSSFTKGKRYNSLLSRKYTLDVTDSIDRQKNNLLNMPIVAASSANSQIRKYLKSLPRKQSLEKTVNKLRESYGVDCARKNNSNTSSIPQPKTESKKPHLESVSKPSKEVTYQIKLLESGWIQDSNGKWMKDPNVEFDSDEDQPPMFT